jgi:hypothetical protein
MMLTEPIAVTLLVIEILESLHVPYFIGGSLASAVHGVVRATMDVDLVADLGLEHVEPLARALGDAFYADAEMMRDAVRRRGSFNLIHLETMFKVDVFVSKERPFDQVQFERRVLQTLTTDPDRAAYVASAEDIILAKLEWYHLGGQASNRQWRDVQNVLKVQGDQLDLHYLDHWAAQLGLRDLLERALSEVAQFKLE